MLAEKLERLTDAFASRDFLVGANLQPGATDSRMDALAEELGVVLPEAFRELYRWRNGHTARPRSQTLRSMSYHTLWFRDTIFIALEDIPQAYEQVNSIYGGSRDNLLPPDDVDLARTVPISEFDMAWYVVACEEQPAALGVEHPVLYVFHGVAPVFDSIESMIDTCIAWVDQPDYSPYTDTPNEREIWEAHNPLTVGR